MKHLAIPLNKLPGSGQKKYKNFSMQSTAHGLRMDSDIVLDSFFFSNCFCHKLIYNQNLMHISLENNGCKLIFKFVKGK